MSKHEIGLTEPQRMDAHRFATNGQPPNPIAFRRIADGFNHVIGRRPKLILCRSANLSSTPGGGTGVSVWPLYFRTGEAQTSVTYYMGMALADTGLLAGAPSLLAATYTAATTTLFNSKNIGFNGQSAGTSVSFAEISHVQIVVTGLSANTEYYTLFSGLFGVRPVYIAAYLTMQTILDDATSGVSNPSSAQSEAPILDLDIEKLVTASNGLWRHNGSHLFSWVADYDVTNAPVTVAGSYTDLLTGDANTRAFRIPATYRTTLTRTTVPVKLAVKASRPSGSGTCDVRLYDGTNSIAITGIDNSATHGWYTATGTIPAADTNTWRIQALDSADPYRIEAVYLFEWEA